ncbi:DUF5946 family protein [Aestuariibius sp. 2305UL40-4]|uniref:DUF5946 family protein n=1 Tax=Aestuariibius violaceus TaxID=3234132 RepID=UPI00345E7D06
MSNIERSDKCVGCGAILPHIDGPTHRYMLSSPACFAQYNRLLAAEYSDLTLMEIHRLTVDAFALQHPGDGVSRQAIQSVGLHLARLGMQLNKLRSPREANDIMLSLGRHKAGLIPLRPPPWFRMTVSDIARFAGTSDHPNQVRNWASSTREDWAEYHDYIIGWAETHLADAQP